jgi:C4-dicarboxylate-binding protein DctP
MHVTKPHPQRTQGVPPRRSILKRTAMAGLLLLAGLGQVQAEVPLVIQFSHVAAADTAKGKAALRFKALAEARTHGRVRVEVYANSTLYKDREELDALKIGAVQMLAPSLSKFANLPGTEFEVFDLPFLFKDHATYRAVVDGPVGKGLLEQLEPSGLKGLAYWDNGFKVFTAREPLRTLGDFKGRKLRVQASRVLMAQMKALGAQGYPGTLKDVYAALKNGQLDGQENVPTNIYSQRLHEVQNHMTVSNHGYLAYAVVVNKAFWDRLPGDVRSTLEGAIRDATSYANAIAEAENSRALEALQASGRLQVYQPSAAELEQWHQAVAPVYQESLKWIRPETLAAVKRAAGAPP